MAVELKIKINGILDLYFLHAMLTFERINIENEVNIFIQHDKERVIQLIKDLEDQVATAINTNKVWWVNKDERRRK